MTQRGTIIRGANSSVTEDSESQPFLSVVVPAYNEAHRIPATLDQIINYLAIFNKPYEVLVVNDGSSDDTAAVVSRFRGPDTRIRLLENPGNCGKGAAVRNGVLNARGEIVLFTDADLSSPIEEADRLLTPLSEGWDVVIGSRALRRDWIGVHQSALREFNGKVFNFFIRLFAGLPIHDTQCGFKAFRREAARAIFPLQQIHGFGFDVEILYIARKLGFRILETPVHWNHAEGSKVHPLRDGLRMGMDVLRIRRNDLAGRYVCREQGIGNRE
jgi:glycosyltransferase involved in cell wall biosynthesis